MQFAFLRQDNGLSIGRQSFLHSHLLLQFFTKSATRSRRFKPIILSTRSEEVRREINMNCLKVILQRGQLYFLSIFPLNFPASKNTESTKNCVWKFWKEKFDSDYKVFVKNISLHKSGVFDWIKNSLINKNMSIKGVFVLWENFVSVPSSSAAGFLGGIPSSSNASKLWTFEKVSYLTAPLKHILLLFLKQGYITF